MNTRFDSVLESLKIYMPEVGVQRVVAVSGKVPTFTKRFADYLKHEMLKDKSSHFNRSYRSQNNSLALRFC